MRYSIERTIIFSPEENTLKLINELETELKLSNQATRLLKEMITNKDIILSRDELLKKIWEDYGFTASGNSLNVAISELRKSFFNLGINPKIITTIHKTGFQFSADVVLLPDHLGMEKTPCISEKQNLHRLAILKNKLRLLSGIKTSLCVIVVMLIIYVIIETAISITDSSFKDEDVTYIYKFKNCNVFILGEKKVERESLAPLLSKEKINCENGIDVFFKRSGKHNQVFKSDFIGVCAHNKNNSYAKCWSLTKSGDI